MDFIKQHKTIIVVVIVVVIAFILYGSFFTGGQGEELLIREDAGIDSEDVALINLLSNLKRITLDESIFDNELFSFLVDYGVDIPKQPVGRANPFAPF